MSFRTRSVSAKLYRPCAISRVMVLMTDFLSIAYGMVAGHIHTDLFKYYAEYCHTRCTIQSICGSIKIHVHLLGYV